MRFLVIAQDYVAKAKALLHELDVRDVEVIGQPLRANEVSPDVIAKLKAQGAPPEASLIRLDKKYRKQVEALVKVKHVEKEFRATDPHLRAWLAPPKGEADVRYKLPSIEFSSAAAESDGLLVLAPNSLARIDEVPEHRYNFMGEAAALLLRLAKGENLGPTRYWKEKYGIAHAGTGQVTCGYTLECGEESVEMDCQDHLKSGDFTTPESAARVYFLRAQFTKPRVVVSYAGPHPPDGRYEVRLTLAEVPDPSDPLRGQ